MKTADLDKIELYMAIYDRIFIAAHLSEYGVIYRIQK